MLHKKSIWWCDRKGSPKFISPGGVYQLWPASELDINKVREYFNIGPVPDYTIDEVQIIHNQSLITAFYTNLKLLQGRKGGSQFEPKWMNDKEDTKEQKHWREVIYSDFKKYSRNFVDPEFPDVSLVPLWHGTRPEHHDSLMKCGYAVLGTTDPGFFGKGVYSTKEAAYAYQFTSHSNCLILNWISIFSVFPVIDKDFQKLYGGSNYQSCDTHWVPVVPLDPTIPNEIIYIPAPPYKATAFTECVIFQTAQCLPRYLVTLKVKLLKDPPIQETQVVLSYCEQGLLCELKGNVVMAITNYKKCMEMDYPPAFIRFFDCIMSWGFLVTIPLPCYETLAKYFTWFETHEDTYCLARCYDEGFGVDKDPVKAVNLYKRIAKEGDVFGNYWLGLHFEKGTGVEKSMKDAILCYIESSKVGYPPAQSLLGFCYENGIGVDEDLGVAYYYYNLASNMGHAGAQANIASFHERGIYVEKNMDIAIKCYQAAAAQGQVTAQFTLGYFYEMGDVIEKNLDQAKYYYSIAAKQGHKEAQYRHEQLLSENTEKPVLPVVKRKTSFWRKYFESVMNQNHM